MIIAKLSGRCRQSPIVLGGEGQSLGTKDALSIGRADTHPKPCFHKLSQIHMSGFAKRYLQDFLATVSFDACSVLDHLFFL